MFMIKIMNRKEIQMLKKKPLKIIIILRVSYIKS